MYLGIEAERALCKMVLIGLFSGMFAACVCNMVVQWFRAKF